MIATRKVDFLPPAQENTLTDRTKRTANNDVVVVFDLEKKDFRSFRLDSILGVDVNV